MEQAGGGTGDQVLKSGSRRPAIPGLVLVRRPRTRLAPSHSGGVGAPPGGTTASCQELADDRWARFAPPTKARPDAVRRTPQQSAERRAGLRHWPVIFGDPKIGPLARRTIGCGASAPAPVGALLPSFFRERKWTKGHPPPPQRVAERWLFDNRIGAGRDKPPHAFFPSPREGGEGWRAKRAGRGRPRRGGDVAVTFPRRCP